MDGKVTPQESRLHPVDDRAWFEDLGVRLKSLGCGPARMQSHHTTPVAVTLVASKAQQLQINTNTLCIHFVRVVSGIVFLCPTPTYTQFNTYYMDLRKSASSCSSPQFIFVVGSINYP